MNANQFIQYCVNQHNVVCNQKYDHSLPYSFHLKRVAENHSKFSHLLNSQHEKEVALMGCWGHDLIEDARITYGDLNLIVGYEVTEVIFACTEEKGKNRLERHSFQYYKDLTENKLGIFVKLCDIMANAKYSLLTNSSMWDKHKAEHAKTLEYLLPAAPEYKPMFDYLTKLFELQ